MKKLCSFIVTAILAVLFCSCVFTREDDFSLCVRNESENESLAITQVFVKQKENAGYVRVWNGNLKSGKSEFIVINKGLYSVKVEVADMDYFGITYSFTTGYNIYKETKNGGALYVCFDGEGLYFE